MGREFGDFLGIHYKKSTKGNGLNLVKFGLNLLIKFPIICIYTVILNTKYLIKKIKKYYCYPKLRRQEIVWFSGAFFYLLPFCSVIGSNNQNFPIIKVLQIFESPESVL